jgi:hypothetical protein
VSSSLRDVIRCAVIGYAVIRCAVIGYAVIRCAVIGFAVIHLRWSSGTVIPKGKGHRLRRLKIRLHSKFELINKN